MLDRIADDVLAELDGSSLNVDRRAVTVTGEGDAVEIVVIPHRHLDGLSLVVWNDARETVLLWAQVTTLDRHDEIDVGLRVSRTGHEGEWRRAVCKEVRRELERSIYVRPRRGLFSRRTECYVRTDRDRRVAVLRREAGEVGDETVTSLAGTRVAASE